MLAVLRLSGSGLREIESSALRPYRIDKDGEAITGLHYELIDSDIGDPKRTQKALAGWMTARKNDLEKLIQASSAKAAMLDISVSFPVEKVSLNLPVDPTLSSLANELRIALSFSVYKTEERSPDPYR